MLRVDSSRIRSTVGDTASIGFPGVTGGSRVTFATGMGVVEASKRWSRNGATALVWDVDVDGVVWEEGEAVPASSDFPPLPFKELAAKKALTGGPITAAAAVNAGGMAPGFSTQFCNVEVDPVTGRVTILPLCRSTRRRQGDPPLLCRWPDPRRGRAGHRWVLNEECIYNTNGRLDNAGFLDYRVPVSSDLPMINAVLVEVPNPAYAGHCSRTASGCPPKRAPTSMP